MLPSARTKRKRHEGTVLFRNRQQNDKYDQVQEGKKDHEPYDPGKFPLECLLFAHWRTQLISCGRTFSGHKAHRNTQAHWRREGGAAHFQEQRRVARFAEDPFLARFWRSSRLFERNGVKPDKTGTDRTADGFVPAPSLCCCSPGGDRYIISWSHRSLVVLAGALPAFSKKMFSSLLALHVAVQRNYCII